MNREQKQQHTPGPWFVRLGRYTPESPVFGFAILANGKVPPIASAGVATPNHATVTEGIASGFSAVECEANGRLIAAAPELLEALEAMTRMYASLVESGDCGFWNPEEVDEVRAARAAIARATDSNIHPDPAGGA
jgi:hypothetical protein